MLFITPRGAFKASTGALELAWALGGWWRLATIFKLVPRPLRDIGYYFIAKNRYRWFGKHDACMMPTPELRARMLS
jgi:predicted DCC family thiol-disulfide oxidoreductase YuxK